MYFTRCRIDPILLLQVWYAYRWRLFFELILWLNWKTADRQSNSSRTGPSINISNPRGRLISSSIMHRLKYSQIIGINVTVRCVRTAIGYFNKFSATFTRVLRFRMYDRTKLKYISILCHGLRMRTSVDNYNIYQAITAYSVVNAQQ